MSASDSAKSRMERILRLHEQIDALKLDIRQVYAEEKADGGDKTAMGAAVSYIRKRDKEGSDLADREAMADVYVAAYDAPRTHTHTREASQSYSEAKGMGFVAKLTDEQMAAALAYDGEDSPVGELTDNQENHHDTDSGQRVGRADDEQRDAARVSSAVGCREGDDEGLEGQGGGVHGTPAYRRRQSGPGQAGEPRVEHRADQDRGSRHVGGEARNEVAAQDDVGATASSTNSTSKPTKGERDAKSSLDFVSEKLLIDGVGQVSGAAFAAVKETGNRTERQPSHDPQNAPAESAADTISATNSHSPDTLPVEADSAGEATSSSLVSPATNSSSAYSAGADGHPGEPSDDARAAELGAEALHERAQSSRAVTNSDDDIPAFIKRDKPDCLKLKDGHCRLSFATSALCAECNQRRAMARALV